MTPGMALAHLFLALAAGLAIGVERTYHGHAAGTRTYALVCMGSALPLIMMSWPTAWLTDGMQQMASVNPAPVIQGILTGIGFLGAGVIVKEGFSVHGLTSAASIWTSATIGVVIGSGYLIPGVITTLVTLIVLAGMRSLENLIDAEHFFHCTVSFTHGETMEERELQAIFLSCHFHVTEMSYCQDFPNNSFRYEAVMWTRGSERAQKLVQTLRDRPDIQSFSVNPSRD